MELVLYTSAFCEPCRQTRAVLAEAEHLIPAAQVHEFDVVRHEAQAEHEGVRTTPTVIVRTPKGAEVFRAEGVPTLNQVLAAAAKSI